MNRIVRTVFRKEILDGWRDRRGLAAALAAVVIGPLVAGLAVSSILSREESDARLELAVVGGAHAPSLVRFLENGNAVVREHSGDVEREIREGRLTVALVVPAPYPDEFRSSRPAKVRLVSDSTRAESRKAAERIRAVLDRYAREISTQRLLARGLNPQVARPLRVDEADLSSRSSRAASALGVFIVYLLVATFVAGTGLAIDATAGERERTTLEALIATSAPPLRLAAGKWLAVVTLNLVGFFVALVVTAAVLTRLPVEVHLSMAASIGIGAPLCLLAAALELLVATTAKSFREGQTYLSMLLMLPVVSGMLVEFSRTELPPWTALVPVVGQHQLFALAVRGQELPASMVVGSGVLALACAVAAVWYLAHLLRREEVILGR